MNQNISELWRGIKWKMISYDYNIYNCKEKVQVDQKITTFKHLWLSEYLY